MFSIAQGGINWLSIPFTSYLLPVFIMIHLSTRLFSETSNRVMEHSDLIIPTCLAKMISFLATIRRSSGDCFFFEVDGINTLDDFKIHCRLVEKFLLDDCDLFDICPTIASRYRSKDQADLFIKRFFIEIDKSTSLDEISLLFYNELG